jgi:high-affinity Fe2+/Pb2+ permease
MIKPIWRTLAHSSLAQAVLACAFVRRATEFDSVSWPMTTSREQLYKGVAAAVTILAIAIMIYVLVATK